MIAHSIIYIERCHKLQIYNITKCVVKKQFLNADGVGIEPTLHYEELFSKQSPRTIISLPSN